MRRILSIMVALIIMLGATSLFAEAKNFYYNGYFAFYGKYTQTFAKETDTGKKWNSSYFSVRARPYFSYKTENVEAVLKLEIDQVLGANGSSSTVGFTAVPGGRNSYLGPMADNQSAIELKNLYMKVKIPDVPGLWIQGGVAATYGAGGTSWGVYLEDSPMIKIGYSFGEKTALGQTTIHFAYLPQLSAAKYMATETTTGEDSSSQASGIYALEADIVVNSGGNLMKIAPTLWYYKSSKQDALYEGGYGFIPQLGFIGILQGKWIIMANFTYGMGKTDDTNAKVGGEDKEYNAWSFLLDVAYMLKPGQKVGLYVRLLSGDDDTTDEKEKAWTQQLGNYGVTALGFRYYFFETGVGRMAPVQFNLDYSEADATHANEQGAYIFGIYGDFNLNSKFTVYAGLAYAMLAQDNKSNAYVDGKSLGVEFDLQVDYKIPSAKAKLFFLLAVLAPGEGYKNMGTTQAGLTIGTILDTRTAFTVALGMDVAF